uniref:Protein yellow n=4 Tax=Cacopsylla melanoneura TaxID=428564 RepID=A0A8D8MGP4_9HEMI
MTTTMSNVSRDLSYSFVWPGDYNWRNAATYPLPGPPLGDQVANLTSAKLQDSSTALPAWLLSMWFMTTIHPPLSSYKQSTRSPLRSKQLQEDNNNINLIVHNSQVPQYVDMPVENQISSIDGKSNGIEVTTFRYSSMPKTYSWTNSEVKTYMPSDYKSSIKTSDISDINTNLVINSNLNEIPETPLNVKSSTTPRSVFEKQKGTFNDFNNILINSKLFKHLNTITAYSPPESNNLTPKDLNNFMTNAQNSMDMMSPLNNTNFMDFPTVNPAPKEFMPPTKEFFGSMTALPAKTTKSKDFSNSIKPTSNELYNMDNYGNKMNSNEQIFHSMESMSPQMQTSFDANVNSMNKPMSVEVGNSNMYFNMDTMPKPTPDNSVEMKVNMNNFNSNNMFVNGNMETMVELTSKDIKDLHNVVMKNNMAQEGMQYNAKDFPNSNFKNELNMFLNNVNSKTPNPMNAMIDTKSNRLPIMNPMVSTNDVKIINNMAAVLPVNPANGNPSVKIISNPNNVRMASPNFKDWEKEFFNGNFTSNMMNIDLKKLKPQTKNENRIPTSTLSPSVPTYRSMPASGPSSMGQTMRPANPGMEQKNNPAPMQASTGPGSTNTDQSKSLYPYNNNNPYNTNPGYPSHFQVFFRWKIIDFVFRDNRQRENLVRSNKFIPGNNLPLGIAIWRNKIFVTFPKWKTGIPVTLASFNMDDPRESPILAPYPNWSYFDDSNCNSMISVFRLSVDKCNRLWVMDTGVTDIITSIQQLCPPKILVFDLTTNTLIRRYILPTAQVFEGSLFSNIATELVEDCDHAFAYVNDVFRYGLIVYDFFKNTSYRLTHPYMYPEPLQSTYILDNLKFRWVDGIFGMAISPELTYKQKRHPYEYYHYNVHHYNGTSVDKTIRDDQRYLYFHSMSSNRHYYISTTDLRNSSRYVNSSDIDEYFHYLGSRHRNTQASASAINSNGVLFYNLVTKHSVGCWNTRTKVYLPQTQDIVQTNRDILNFPNDLKIDQQDNIWVLSNKLHQYLYGFLDFNVYNYRILVASSNDIVRNTKCDPYVNLNDYLYNLQISSRQCPNNEL